MKKKFIFVLVAVVALVVVIPTAAEALDLGSGLAKGTAVEAGFDANTNETTFAATIGELVKALLSFVGVLFLVLTVYAGFLWMSARGEESQIEKAQSILRSAIIGMIITVGAYSITSFIVPRIVDRTAGDQTTSGQVRNRTQCYAACESSLAADLVAQDACKNACTREFAE